MIRTGIFGGSFNPIHNGHITLAQQLRQRAALDEVWLMVTPQNPLKHPAELLGDEARLEMARRALEGIEGVKASDYEMRLPKPSYTWNTLQALKEDYPEREFVLLMGGDNWDIFDRWYRADDIKRGYEIVVYTRSPGDDGYMDISSTEIRRRIREHRDISGMVPQGVEALIKKNGYYAEATEYI